MAEIGYIVSDIVITGPERGAYKVWIPKKHGDPTGKSSYSGFGSNFGNLGSAELALIQSVAEYCFPITPLQPGGHMPFDPNSGLVSVTEINPDITSDTTTSLNNRGQFKEIENYRKYNNPTFQLRQTEGAAGLCRIYTPDFRSGTMVNLRQDSPSNTYVTLSLGTKVAVSGNIILGQMPQTNNDIINQLRPLDQD